MTQFGWELNAVRNTAGVKELADGILQYYKDTNMISDLYAEGMIRNAERLNKLADHIESVQDVDVSDLRTDAKKLLWLAKLWEELE